MRIAVICSVYNEETLLPQFLDYYSSQVDQIFLLDNESTDGTRAVAERYPNVVVSSYSSGGKFSDVALSDAYDRKRQECVRKYDYVIIADCDEFIVPKNGLPLALAIEAAQPNPASGLRVEFFWAHGFNMWRKPEGPPYDPARSILAQRTAGIESRTYSKPCVIRPESRIEYDHGRHGFRGRADWKPKKFDDATFYLLHYIGFDQEIYVKRAMERTARFAESNVQMKTSIQYHDKTERSYRDTFHLNSHSPDLVEVPFRVPPAGRRRLNIGSGKTPTSNHDTVDKDPALNPTYSFDLTSPNWPAPDATYDEVLVVHVLEHIATPKVGIVLRRILKIMKPGGTLRIHVPNAPFIAKACAERPEQLFKIYGAEVETDPALARKILYDFSTLGAALTGAGFLSPEDVTDQYEDHHDPHWAWMVGRLSLKVRARKPCSE